jgi:hypothetical protein
MNDDATIRNYIMKLQFEFLWLLVIIFLVIYMIIVYEASKQLMNNSNIKKKRSGSWITIVNEKANKLFEKNKEFAKMFTYITIVTIILVVLTLLSSSILKFFLRSVPNEVNVFELAMFICILYIIAVLISWNELRKTKKSKNKHPSMSLLKFAGFSGLIAVIYSFIQYVDLVQLIFVPLPYIVSKWNPTRYLYFDFIFNVYRLEIGKFLFTIIRLFRLPAYLFIPVIFYLIMTGVVAVVYILILQVVKGNKETLSIFCKRGTDDVNDECVKTLRKEIYHISLGLLFPFIFYNVIWKQFH